REAFAMKSILSAFSRRRPYRAPQRFAHGLRKRRRSPRPRVEADFDGLLRRAQGHRLALVEPHFVAKTFAAGADECAGHERGLSRGQLMMEIDGQRRDNAAEPLRM